MTLRCVLWLGSLALLGFAFYVFSDEGNGSAALFVVVAALIVAMFLWAGGIHNTMKICRALRRRVDGARHSAIRFAVVASQLGGTRLSRWLYRVARSVGVWSRLHSLVATPTLARRVTPPLPFPTAIVVEQ